MKNQPIKNKQKELIDFTKKKFGLDDYYLKHDELYRDVNIFNETIYILSMAWFPNHITEREDDDSNPEGVAVIDIEVQNRKFHNAIFVGGKSFGNGISFYNDDVNTVINWVEQETKLRYGTQFQIEKEAEREYYFTACIDGIPVSPEGSIEIKFDQEGKLTFFAIYGEFPSGEIIQRETYTLSLEKIDYLAKRQLKLIESPSFEEERLFPIYAVEEIYITNDQKATVPFESIVNEKAYVKVDETIKWETPIVQPFEGIEIELTEDISVEQALLCEPSPDSFPITMTEREKCIVAVSDFLRKEYQDDTGKWKIKALYRDNGYICATLRLKQRENRAFRRKLTIMIDPNSFEVLNYIDNNMLLEMFNHFQPSAEVTMNQEEAYEKIKGFNELKPYYVYDFEQKQYILCGKFDCQYGVNAVTGEIITLDDL